MSRPKSLKPSRPEAVVLQQVVEAAATLGVKLDRRNTGAGVNPSGKTVRFGTPGDSDLVGVIPVGPNRGIQLAIEVKREGFDPSRLTGKAKAHFDRQLARLQEVNASGGVAFWTSDSVDCLTILQHVLAGASVYEPGYGRPVVTYGETS